MIIKNNMSFKDLIKLLLLPSLIYIFNTTFENLAFNFYHTNNIDTISHFLGGITIAHSASYGLSLLEKKGWINIKKNILRLVIITGIVMIFAVCWEFYEFLSDLYLGTSMQPSLPDTIKDLCMGMLGAIVFCLVSLNRKNN